jgi:hypothetical protein
MIRGDAFIPKLHELARQQDLMLADSLNLFLDHILANQVYVPSNDELFVQELITSPDHYVNALYYVTREVIGGRPRSYRYSSGLDHRLDSRDFAMLQLFIEEFRTGLGSSQRLDPETILLPCPAQAMILMMTQVHRGLQEPEFYLLLDTSLEPLAGAQMIYHSMMHWRDTEPSDPMFSAIYPIQ